MSRPLEIRSFCLGDFQTNCYLVRPEGSSRCWFVDAGQRPGAMIDAAQRAGLTPEAIVLTHAHGDHIAGVDVVRAAWPGTPVWLHRAEADFLGDPMQNLSGLFGAVLAEIRLAPAERLLEGGERLDLDGVSFEVRHTPGHSPGGITLYQADNAVALVGDTLFYDSVGRVDFPHSDPEQMRTSLRDQLLSLPNETRVLPGHMIQTTIGRERAENPFLAEWDLV